MPAKITGHQLFALLCLFFLGGISYISGATEGGRDSWLCFLIGGLLFVPLLFCCLELTKGESSIPGVFRRVGGKWVGGFLCLTYGLLAIYVAAVAMSVFIYFISETALLATPRVILALIMGVTIAFMLRGGLPALGRFGEMVLPLIGFFLLVSILVTLPQSDFRALLPIARNGKSIFLGSWTALLLPFGECFFPVLALCTGIRDHKERVRGSLGALVFAAVTLCLIFIKNLAALDYHAVTSYYFPSFAVASMVSLGTFFQRFEILVAVNFLFCQLCKAGLCLLFAQKALAPFTRTSPRLLAVPLSLTAANIALLLFRSQMELFTWLGLYKYFLTPFLVFGPPLLLLGRKLRTRRLRKTPGRE